MRVLTVMNTGPFALPMACRLSQQVAWDRAVFPPLHFSTLQITSARCKHCFGGSCHPKEFLHSAAMDVVLLLNTVLSAQPALHGASCLETKQQRWEPYLDSIRSKWAGFWASIRTINVLYSFLLTGNDIICAPIGSWFNISLEFSQS